MKLKNFARTATLVAAVSATALLTGCGQVIDEGNFGIEKYWGGEYNQESISQGYKFNILDSIYEVHGREMLLQIEDAKPKDKDRAMLEDLDLSISIKTLKDGAIPFVLKTGDIVKIADKNTYMIGVNYVKKDAKSVLSNTIQKFTSEEMLDNTNAVEEAFKKDLQVELNKLYGKAFSVEEVKISNIKVSKSIEEKIQAVSAVKAETEKNAAVMRVLASREAVLTQEATLLKRASEKTGVSIDSILQNEMIKAIRDSAGETKVQVTVPVTPGKK